MREVDARGESRELLPEPRGPRQKGAVRCPAPVTGSYLLGVCSARGTQRLRQRGWRVEAPRAVGRIRHRIVGPVRQVKPQIGCVVAVANLFGDA